MEDELRCPSCKELFVEPVLLPCWHALCLACAVNLQAPPDSPPESTADSSNAPGSDQEADKLSILSETDSGVVCSSTSTSSRPGSYVGTPGNGGGFPPSGGTLCLSCPICQKTVYFDEGGAHNLPKYWAMQHIVDKYQESRNARLQCQMCEGEPRDATVACEQCEVLYCDACRESCHPKRGPLATHNLGPPRGSWQSNGAKGSRPENTPVCNDHNGEAVTLYCALCKIAICALCLRDRHAAHPHDVLPLAAACKAQKVRRGLHRLQDALALVEKNTLGLQTNCASVVEEVDEIYRRLSKALKDRTEYLRNEVDRYLGTELRGLIQLKENLELEIANIQSNCDLAEAHINENVPWDDAELLDTKELFLRTVEFIRNFEYEAGDYSRRVRFVMAHDPNQLVLHVAGYGELNIKPESGSGGLLGSSSSLAPPGGSPGLMRSKSDHRLASQYRQQEEERLARNRYVPEYEYEAPEYEVPRNKSRYRSRFMRHRDGDDSDGDSRSTVRFTSTAPQEPSGLRERVLDTEDAARGPLSGIFRLTDSPRVMKKLQECERAGKRKKEEPTSQPQVQQPQTPKPQVQVRKVPTAMARQTSEDDEISRIKKQNKNAAATTTVAAVHAETVEERQPTSTPVSVHPPPSRELSESEEQPVRKSAIARRTSAETHVPPAARSASSDSSTGSESSTGSGIRNTGAPFTTEEMKQKYLSRAPPTNTSTTVSSVPAVTSATTKESSNTTVPTPRTPFQSRFLGAGNRAAPPPPIQTPREEPVTKKKEEEEDEDEETSSSSEETESDTEEESETDVHPSNATPSAASATSQDRQRNESAMARTDIGPLLARSAEARRGSKEDSPSIRYSSPRGSPAQSVTTTTTTMTAPSGGGAMTTTSTTPGGYTSRAFSADGSAERGYSADRGEDDNKVIAATTTIADDAFNVDADALETPRATNTRSSRTDIIITDTDNSITSSTSSHLAISKSESNLLEDSRGNSRIASVASENEATLVEGRSGNDEISLVIVDRERDGSILAIDDDSEMTRRRDDVVLEKRENSDDTPCFLRIVVEDVDAIIDEQHTLDLTNQAVETIIDRRDRSRSKESQTISECSSSISGRTMSDSESESDSESGSEEEDEEEIEDESRDENCNVKKDRKKEEKNDSGDKGSAKREVSEKSDEGPSSPGDDEETTVLSVSSDRGESNMTPDDRYERDLKRRSASIIDERSIEEMFDDNGWVITEQDLQQDLQPVSAIPSGFRFMVDRVENDYDGTRIEETISKIAEREHDETSNDLEGTSARSSIAIDDETTPPSEQQASEGPSRSRVYRQSSLGKNGWLVSDESESESERAISPGIKVPYDRDVAQNEASRGIEDSGIDENGWVILDDDGDADDGRIGERSAQESTIRSQTIDLITNTNTENGALLANVSRSKGEQSGLLGEHEETPPVAANLSIPVQMVTTVFCVSVLCYTVLTNLLL